MVNQNYTLTNYNYQLSMSKVTAIAR